MKNVMRAISLGLVCAIATSNVAQATILDTLQRRLSSGWHNIKQVTLKKNLTIAFVQMVTLNQMARAAGDAKLAYSLYSKSMDQLNILRSTPEALSTNHLKPVGELIQAHIAQMGQCISPWLESFVEQTTRISSLERQIMAEAEFERTNVQRCLLMFAVCAAAFGIASWIEYVQQQAGENDLQQTNEC